MDFGQDPNDNVINHPAMDAGAMIFDADLQNFEERVIKASMERPVLVDFWAPWCGPCKQLMPTLEKMVNAAAGKVALAKVNLDENQQLAGMLRVQSVPTVYAFFQGQPIDAFQGNVPESQIQGFVDKLIQTARAAQPDALDIPEALSGAAQALAEGDLTAAQAIYGQILQADANNAPAYTGMIRVFVAAGEVEKAAALLDQAPERIKKDSAFAEAKSAVELAAAKPDGDTATLEAALAKNGDDHQARFDLALHQFSAGQREAAVENLLTIIEKKRDWNEEAARHQLLKFFEAMGHSDPITIAARKKLSSILFS